MKLQRVAVTLAILSLFTLQARAIDQVQMRNGDRYAGTVVSLNADTLVIQSDVLGKVSLPRAQVSAITLNLAKMAAAVPSTNRALPKATGSIPDTNSEIGLALRNLGSKTNLTQINQELLSQAGPEASKKYYEMLSGLLTGKLSMNDLRTEAKSVADQVRSLKTDLGPDAGSMIDGYLAILDNFLKETAPASGTLTNKAAK